MPPRRPHPNPLRSNPSFGYSGSSGTYRSQVEEISRKKSHIHQNRDNHDDDTSLDSINSDSQDTSEDDDDDAQTMAERPPYNRPTGGRSGTPLLARQTTEGRGRTRSKYGVHSPTSRPSSKRSLPPPYYNASRPQSTHTRRSFSAHQTLRSISPAALAAKSEKSVRQKWLIAGAFLVLSLVSFVIQTELGKTVQTDLGWNKAYCMLYLTHGSWSLLFPTQLLILRVRKRSIPWDVFWHSHWKGILSTGWEVQHQKLSHSRRAINVSPHEERAIKMYILRTTAVVTTALTVAGLSWYIAVSMTSASDLTAIYNCSAFFAYAFSVPLLKEPLRLDKSVAVLIAIAGVLVVAYGDSKPTAVADGDSEDTAQSAGTRFMGNIIIGVGSVLYGLYEVLYKRLACPPEGASSSRSVIFANTFGSCIGCFTLGVLWIPLPFLHWLGWETFELPTGHTALLLFLSVIMNATFAGSFLVLISLTSPVLSSVAALLTIFLVAISDWALTGEPLSTAAIIGGLLIVIAFAMLSWSTWREMSEHAKQREAEEEECIGSSSSDDSDDDGENDGEDAGAYHGDDESRRMLG